MRTRMFVAVLALLLLSACSKPVPPEKMDYVGEWRSREMALLILPDGTVAYKRLKNGGTTSVNGPLKEFAGDGFVVGIGFLTTKFIVSEPPHKREGQWQMVVDGVRLSKVEE